VADLADIGNERAEELLADALAAHRAAREAERDSVLRFECVECGEVLPVARRMIGACRCIDCQRWYEQELKRAAYRGETN
jgi:RNA polymerase-binding transcription factor DksA